MALIKCSECGKEISEEATTCPNCGKPISVKTAEDKPIQKFSGAVSISKFIILDLATFGIYPLFWMYRQWKLMNKMGLDISPFWRAFFAPLWTGSLGKNIKLLVEERNITISYNYIIIGISYFILSASWRLPDPYWLISLISFVPLLPLVTAMNKFYESENAGLPEKKLTWWQIVLVALGLLCVGLAILDTLFPVT